MPTPAIDVIIVTMRAREQVLSCLEHLARQTVPHTTYLADNANNEDGTSDAVRERFPAVRLVTFAQNRGFGGAVGVLAARGSGEFIVLVNDDMDVEPRFLEELIAPFERPEVGMAAGMTLQPGGEGIVDGFGIEVDRTLMGFNRLRHRRPDEPAGVLLGPSGGAAAYRRSAWEAVGGFEPRIFAYQEDLDLALRLRLAGWAPAAAPGARGVHLGGATAGVDSPLQRWCAGFGRSFVLRRYGILRTRHAPRALVIEALTVLKGLVSARTTIPLRARVAGWRAAGHGARLPVPPGAVDERITFRQTLHRVRFER